MPEYKSVTVTKGRGGWGGPLTITPSDERPLIYSVTGGGIHPVAQRIADLTGGEPFDGFKSSAPFDKIAVAVIDCGDMPATSARNREPFSPSTCRWSKESASVVTWRTTISSPRTTHGILLDRAEAQDRRLARVDDRRAAVDAEDADVGDRERAAAHVGRLGLARRGRSR